MMSTELREHEGISDGPIEITISDSSPQKSIKGETNSNLVTFCSTDDTRYEAPKKISYGRWLDSLPPKHLKFLDSMAAKIDDVCNRLIRCTACNVQMNPNIPGLIERHPIICVCICKACKRNYFSGLWLRDTEGYLEYCRWCASGGDLICCSKCKDAFCVSCIKRNLGRGALFDIKQMKEWICFRCNIYKIIEHCSLYRALRLFWRKQETRDRKEHQHATKIELKMDIDQMNLRFKMINNLLISLSKKLNSHKRMWRMALKRSNFVEDGKTIEQLNTFCNLAGNNFVDLKTKLMNISENVEINSEPVTPCDFDSTLPLNLDMPVSEPVNAGTFLKLEQKNENDEEFESSGSKNQADVKAMVIRSSSSSESIRTPIDTPIKYVIRGNKLYKKRKELDKMCIKSGRSSLSSKFDNVSRQGEIDLGQDDVTLVAKQSTPIGKKLQSSTLATSDLGESEKVVLTDENDDIKIRQKKHNFNLHSNSKKGVRSGEMVNDEDKKESAKCSAVDHKRNICETSSFEFSGTTTNSSPSNETKQVTMNIDPNYIVSVRLIRLLDAVLNDLRTYGYIYVDDADVSIKGDKQYRSDGDDEDDDNLDEIHNLCNLDFMNDSDSLAEDKSYEQEDESPVKKEIERPLKHKHTISGKKHTIADDTSNGEDDLNDDSDSFHEMDMEKTLSLPKRIDDVVHKAVIGVSSSSSNDEVVSDGEVVLDDGVNSVSSNLKNSVKAGRIRKRKIGKRHHLHSTGSSKPAFLTMKLSETDSSEEEKKAALRHEKMSKCVSSSILSDDSNFVSEDSDIIRGDGAKASVKNRKKPTLSSSSLSSSSSSAVGLNKKHKRRRIKTNSDSSSKSDNLNVSPTKGGRKDIRKIIKDKDMSLEYKEAANDELERRRRIDERQLLYNKLFEVKEGDVLKELPLEYDDAKVAIVEVHSNLAKNMKPHQARGVKFMWDAVFESQKHIENDKFPGGCILAHCMGLGKTLQTIALVHTVHCQFPLKLKRILILCPVNTLKNWIEEFEKWLKEPVQDINVFEMCSEKNNWDRTDKLKIWIKDGGVLVMGYDMFRNLSNSNNKKFKKRQKEVFEQALINPGPDMVVCDEGHVLKNTKSALNICVARIKTLRRVILTGTPLQNNLTEYYAMVNFIKPNLFGSYSQFKNRFVNPIQNGQHADSTHHDVRIMKKRSFILNDMLKGCMQRLDYKVLAPYLQRKHEYVLCICLTKLQKKLYMYYLENYARAGQMGEDGKLEGGRKGGLFYDVQNLSLIWNHPYLLKLSRERRYGGYTDEDDENDDEMGSLKDFINDDSDESSSSKSEVSTKEDANIITVDADPVTVDKFWWSTLLSESGTELIDVEHGNKIVLLMEILTQCELLGDKVLVFSQSILSLNLIEEFLKFANKGSANTTTFELDVEPPVLGSWVKGKDYFRLDGSTSPDVRKKQCAYFNNINSHRMRLFLISTRAGGLGINLVAANRVIIFDASWNPAHDVQSIFRVYRFGQKKPVYIYRFLSMGTMEEKIYDRQVTKQSLSARVVDEQQIERHFTMNELSDLYVYKDEKLINAERPIPKVPEDRLLAELLKKFDRLIWKYHDHDSLLENQVEENLSQEERKAAWQEFENEKNGLVIQHGAGVPSNLNLNPQLVQEWYRRMNPSATHDEIVMATRTYIQQVTQSPVRPVYDRNFYRAEMERARAKEKQMYPGMYAASGASTSRSSLSAGGLNMVNLMKKQQQMNSFNSQQNSFLQKPTINRSGVAVASNEQPQEFVIEDQTPTMRKLSVKSLASLMANINRTTN